MVRWNYPENWETMRKAMFEFYGGKYCIKYLGSHDGYINVHHHIPISRAVYAAEYYFLNQPWNLLPLCEKHHGKEHAHYNPNITTDYKKTKSPRGKAAGLTRRIGWKVKRRRWKKKFDNRINDEKLLSRFSYWGFFERRAEKNMHHWPDKYLEDFVITY